MGLSLRLNLFHEVEARHVYGAYAAFYAKRRQELISSGDDFYKFTLHEREQGWTVLSLDGGWEWTFRRQAQLYVSRQLNCKAF